MLSSSIWSLVAALTSLVTFSLAAAAISDGLPSLNPRSDLCYNAPNTIAGTFLNRRTLFPRGRVPFLLPKMGANPQLWCAPHCKTYVNVTYISAIPGQSWQEVENLMSGAKANVQRHLQAMGDDTIRGGTFLYQFQDMEMYFHDSNNHQLTWGVLGAALIALTEYFDEVHANSGAQPGSITFVVHDGENEVATGGFGAVQAG